MLNSDDTLLVFTSYPDSEHGIRDLNAVAWYAQKTLKALSKKQKILVLAEKTGRNKVHIENSRLKIVRTWKRNRPLSLFNIFPYIIKYYKVQNVLFQFEFNILGGIMPVLVLPLILGLLKLVKKNVYFEFHQVVLDIAELEKHINVTNQYVQKALNIGLLFFYKVVGALSDKVIVLEQELKDRLTEIVPEEKIVVLPITVAKRTLISKTRAKNALGFEKKDFVVLVFGFVNWYKGSDWIASSLGSKRKSSLKLVLAGGKNPTLKNKRYYRSFYHKIYSLVKKDKNVLLTGFVPEEKISLYFSAADLVVLPYRIFMSASGPFSFALSYRKPVLLSKRLNNYVKSPDFSYALDQLDIDKNDVFFDLNKHELKKKIKKIRTDRVFAKKLKQFSVLLAQKRNVNHVLKEYRNVVSRPYMVRSPFMLQFSK